MSEHEIHALGQALAERYGEVLRQAFSERERDLVLELAVAAALAEMMSQLDPSPPVAART